MSAVLYLRLSEERKQALAARARERGLSLNASACELIARGLQADEEEQARERLEQERRRRGERAGSDARRPCPS